MSDAPYVHRFSHHIAMSEVDVAQIHFTTFHRLMDRGLTLWLAAVGRPFTALLETGPGIPIVSAKLDISQRVLLDDIVDVETWIGEIGRTSFRSRYRISRDGQSVAVGELVHVCVERVTRDTVAVPDWLRHHTIPDGEGPGE